MNAAVKTQSTRWPGVLLVLTSGCCWGFHGVLIKFALELGASFLQVFLFETIFATLFFGIFWKRFYRNVRPSSLKEWMLLGAIGVDTIAVGYFLFLSFSLGPVAIGATLMFMYLPAVYTYSLLAKHQGFSAAKFLAICLVLAGAVLTTEILSSLHGEGTIPAMLAALAASMGYALVFILTPKAAAYSTAELRSFAASGIGMIGSLIILVFVPGLWFPLEGNFWLLAGMACLLGAIGQTLPVITLMKGLPLTGSSLGGVLASVELPIAVFTAALFLGESLNLWKVIGVILILSGIVIYNLSDQNR